MNYLPQRHRGNLNSPHPFITPLPYGLPSYLKRGLRGVRGGARGRYSASQRLSGGFIVVVFFFLINPFLSNAAEIYRWIDDDGVVHITDDRSNIPEKYWEQGRVKKEEIKPSRDKAQPVAPEPAQTYKEGDAGEVYGDYPLEWWINTFRELRQNISDTKTSLARGKNFVTVFEGGRGYGKIYSKEEIAQYERSKADIPVMEENLKNLNKELEELQRKARTYGVPRKIIE